MFDIVFTLNFITAEGEESDSNGEATRIPLNESLTRFHQMRKRSDLQLIKCVQQKSLGSQYVESYPLSQVRTFSSFLK